MSKTHGHNQKTSRVYRCWCAMKRRCNNPNAVQFKYYGGKGIRVCARWQSSFEAFLSDMGEPPEGMTLDRIDPNGHYEPGNCRWATDAVQKRNRSCVKLDEDKVRAIRRDLAEGNAVRALGRRYGVSATAISRIRDGLLYSHVI